MGRGSGKILPCSNVVDSQSEAIRRRVGERRSVGVGRSLRQEALSHIAERWRFSRVGGGVSVHALLPIVIVPLLHYGMIAIGLVDRWGGTYTLGEDFLQQSHNRRRVKGGAKFA